MRLYLAILAVALAAARLPQPALADDGHGRGGREGGGHEQQGEHRAPGGGREAGRSHEQGGRPPFPGREHFDYDQRYSHDRYYPRRGYAFGALPGGSLGIGFGGGNYFFHGGVWFRPYGGRYVVIEPPIGIVVPLLPPAYVTLQIAGAPYYYANGVYYAQAPGQGYTVVTPPPGAEAAQPVPPMTVAAAPGAPIIYPRDGQSADQLESDRQECGKWANAQPNAADAGVFLRALAACMDGRGYTVR